MKHKTLEEIASYINEHKTEAEITDLRDQYQAAWQTGGGEYAEEVRYLNWGLEILNFSGSPRGENIPTETFNRFKLLIT